MKPRVIGLTGAAGAGKSTAAGLLAAHGYTRTRFADPLKAMLRAFGLTEAQVDGGEKESPCALLGGATPRWAMQTLGTEWGRDLVHPDLWVLGWAAKVDAMDGAVVVDDLRFPNEATAIRARGGVIIRIERPGHRLGQHVSEAGQARLSADAVLVNEGTPLTLRAALDQLLRERSWV